MPSVKSPDTSSVVPAPTKWARTVSFNPWPTASNSMGKQLTTPRDADPFIFWVRTDSLFHARGPVHLPIPFGPELVALDLNLGIVLILAFAGLGVLSLCLAGWGSNNKWSLLGAARAVAQNVAYEIPLLLAVLSVAFMTGSLNLATISSGQGAWPWQWNVLINPLGFIIYFICALAETNRAPFDLPEAESELTAGFHTEYSGMGLVSSFWPNTRT